MSVVQGKEVIEFYINELLTEGIYHIATWSESNATETGTQSAACGTDAASASSGPALMWAASSSSPMQLGACAGNIVIENEGIHITASF